MWQRVSEKLYRITINEELTDLKVPYASVELLFSAFISGGGMIDAQGQVQTDPIMLVSNFKKVGNILLTKFGTTGEVLEAGNCTMLSSTEISELFEVAMEIIQDFLKTITKMSAKKEAGMVEKSAEEKNLTP